jgi:hypothetical protein
MAGLGAGIAALNIAGRLTGAKAALAKIPPKVWYALAAIALLVGGYFYHQHRAHQHDKALVKSTIEKRDAQWRTQISKEHAAAVAWKGQADQLHAQIAQDERTNMTKIFASTLPLLMLCACGDQAPPQLIADKAIIPALPPLPIDTTKPLPQPALPQLKCLQTTGQLCPGTGS